jgi:hypothetical protein
VTMARLVAVGLDYQTAKLFSPADGVMRRCGVAVW